MIIVPLRALWNLKISSKNEQILTNLFCHQINITFFELNCPKPGVISKNNSGKRGILQFKIFEK